MANPLGLVKAHPVASTVIGVIIFVVVLLFLNSGGGGGDTVSAAGGSNDAELAASSAMQQLQAQLAARGMEINAQKEVALADNATKLTLAQLTKDVALADLFSKQSIREAELGAAERTTTLTSTLAAQTQQQQMKYEFDSEIAEQNNTLAQLRLFTGTQLSMQKEANKPKGLFSWLFG